MHYALSQHKFYHFLKILLIIFLIYGCRSYPIQLTQSDEVLFKGNRAKLRLLTSIYKPYRAYKEYVSESIIGLRAVYPSIVDGEEVELSGTLIIPKNAREPLPLLVYCHGTMFDQRLAPSLWESAVQLQALPAMDGYITFIPDYVGYGVSAERIPAYFNQQETVQSIVDMLDFGLSLLNERDVIYRKELYVMGYSQGGHAALSLQKFLEASNPFDLQLEAVVSMAGPFQLKENVDFILKKDKFKTPAYISYLFASYNFYLWERDMDEFFQSPSGQYIKDFLNGNISLNSMSLKQTKVIRDLMAPGFLDRYLGTGEQKLKSSLVSNSDFRFIPKIPTMIIHSRSDEVVPFETSYDTWNQMIDSGADSTVVKHMALDQLSHAETALYAMPIGLGFLRTIRDRGN